MAFFASAGGAATSGGAGIGAGAVGAGGVVARAWRACAATITPAQRTIRTFEAKCEVFMRGVCRAAPPEGNPLNGPQPEREWAARCGDAVTSTTVTIASRQPRVSATQMAGGKANSPASCCRAEVCEDGERSGAVGTVTLGRSHRSRPGSWHLSRRARMSGGRTGRSLYGTRGARRLSPSRRRSASLHFGGVCLHAGRRDLRPGLRQGGRAGLTSRWLAATLAARPTRPGRNRDTRLGLSEKQRRSLRRGGDEGGRFTWCLGWWWRRRNSSRRRRCTRSSVVRRRCGARRVIRRRSRRWCAVHPARAESRAFD